ncbi:hypothetical protein M5689_023576 [Euphorbia peplus]|nr:hypothetical protein M5689_023576 [Euphorbia peplus]
MRQLTRKNTLYSRCRANLSFTRAIGRKGNFNFYYFFTDLDWAQVVHLWSPCNRSCNLVCLELRFGRS